MPEITDIAPQVKDKKRCSIYLDGKFFCGMLLETVINNRLKVGDHIEIEELERLQLENEKSQALDRAMGYLTRSMKTEKQVTDYLAKKGYTGAVIDYVLFKLKDYKFVNDLEYGKSYALDKSRNKGKRLIRLELKNKGVSDEDIDRALSKITDETDSAKNLLKKYMKSKEPTVENYYKAFKYLLSKGFDYETANQAVSDEKGAEIEYI